MTKLGLLPVIGLLIAALARAGAAEAALPTAVQFNRDVRPIMANTCFKCHGPDLKANKADLRLDLPDNARMVRKDKTGKTTIPIVPGNPGASDVWRRVSSADAGQVMPPPDSLHLLSARDKAVIKLWIEQGAVYEPHWAYIPPKKAGVPAANTDSRNPIDHFVLAELKEHGIAPSPEADRRTLLRRVSLDLVGLPPTVAETEAFLADTKPGAYERVVDRLLASPHYGERMAVEWLDLARFADTVGYHGDQQYNNFPYRDYVIDSFNRNEPFDQFTREQIAGDLLPNATVEQRVASGFNRLNMVTREGGAQPREYIAKYAGDRVRTISTTWLGSTMGCCECHDHKYDPFKSRDFYAMGAYFADIKQWGVYEDYAYTPEPELKGMNNDSPFPPEIEVDSPYLKARRDRLTAECRDLVARMTGEIGSNPAQQAAARAWAAKVAPLLASDPEGWAPFPIGEAKARKAGTVTVLPDESIRFDFEKLSKGERNADRSGDGIILTSAPLPGPSARVRLEVLPDDSHGGKVTSTGEDFFALTINMDLRRAGQDKLVHVQVSDAFANQPTATYANGHIQTSLPADWTSSPALARTAQSVVYILSPPIDFQAGDQLVATISSENVGRIRLSVSPLGVQAPGAAPLAEAAAALAARDPTPGQAEIVTEEFFAGTEGGRSYEFGQLMDKVREIAACRDGKAFTTVTVATTPAVTRVLARGNWQDESGEIVSPSPPRFLTGGKPPAADAPRQTRLDLANWIVSRDNPLTSRTFVNRLWKQFFGTALSSIVDDLGTQGEYPSHPELLDWLAVEFMERDWDVKSMVRLIVTSDTYRQSSNYRPELADVDPNNRLLARQEPRRLEAEFVRDNALAAAGLICLDIGGPSVHPYQPEGYYAALQFPDRDYSTEGDERAFRRGVYMHWQRTFLHPMLANFDAPSREECTASRNISSTPQQALTLLNDPTFVEAARGLAEQALSDHGKDDFVSTLDEAFMRLLARPPTAPERESLREFYEGQLNYYTGKPAEAEKAISVGMHPPGGGVDWVTLAAWTSVTRVMLNLNETIVRY
jgi:hypothetical protein